MGAFMLRSHFGVREHVQIFQELINSDVLLYNCHHIQCGLLWSLQCIVLLQTEYKHAHAHANRYMTEDLVMLELFSYFAVYHKMKIRRTKHICAFDHHHRSHVALEFIGHCLNSFQSFLIVATSLTNTLWTLAWLSELFANYLLLCEPFTKMVDCRHINKQTNQPTVCSGPNSVWYIHFLALCAIFDIFTEKN